MYKIVWKYDEASKDSSECFRFVVDVKHADAFETELTNLSFLAYERFNDKGQDGHFGVYFSPRAEPEEFSQVLVLGEEQVMVDEHAKNVRGRMLLEHISQLGRSAERSP